MTQVANIPADSELLSSYVATGSEGAFAELVHRHLNLVHSAALRQVQGDAAAAADVAQTVFIELARQASGLTRHPALIGWLYTTTHRMAARHLRDGIRRQCRERDAHAMREIQQLSESEIDWSRLAPVLDRVMHELAEADRLALLLRYFEKRPFVEVGARLGLNENAARMRVDRALDRLRGHLADRGITSTASALALVLSGQAIIAAPAGLGQTVASAALAAVAISIPTFGFLSVMTSTKIKVSAIVVGCALLGTLVLVQRQKLQKLRTEQDALLEHLAEQSAALSNAQQLVGAKEAELEAARGSNQDLMRLRGEVARLRRDLAQPAARSNSTNKPAIRSSPPLITKVRTQVPAGSSMVVGGWNWSEGRRTLMFLTPVVEEEPGGERVVLVQTKLAQIPELMLAEFGLGRFATSDDPEAHEMMTAARVQELLDHEIQTNDKAVVMNAQVRIGDGQKMNLGMGTEKPTEGVIMEISPTVLPDGQIDLTLAGKQRPPPDAKGR